VTSAHRGVVHAFTIDAEDWPQLMCSYLGRDLAVSPQFETSIARTLDLLDEHNTKATFFVVAPHARQKPAIVREIVARGHEVASHGTTHHKLVDFSPQAFREDIRRAVDVLQQITGERVVGHRCPFFSLMPGQAWAFEILIEAGLEYDSSLTSLLWQRAGTPVPHEPFVVATAGGREIVELPALARKFGPFTGRLIGGRTLRVFPASAYRAHMREREAEGVPAMVYVHSYEVTPDRLMRYVPRGLSGRERLKLAISAQGFEVGMGRMAGALLRLLREYRWAPMREVARALREGGNLPRVEVSAQGEVLPSPAGAATAGAG
jgi:polysaccharide deacetylase family protein (PEP-CTERM system associated)